MKPVESFTHGVAGAAQAFNKSTHAKAWADRMCPHFLDKLAVGDHNADEGNPAIIVANIRLHPDTEMGSVAHLEAMKRWFYARGWHYAEYVAEGHTLRLGIMATPVTVFAGEDSFDVPYRPGFTAQETAERIGREGTWRYAENGEQFFIPVHMIKWIEVRVHG